METIKSAILWLVAVITLASCAASRKVEQGSSEQRCDSAETIVKDSVSKSVTSVDSTVSSTTTEQFTTSTMADKGSNEETITERVTESVDVSGNKTTTTDRTIHRKGDYERNATYEAQMKHQDEIISQMQHTIDSLVLSSRLNVGTHWAKKGSVNLAKEKNTKEVKPMSDWSRIVYDLFLLFVIGSVVYCLFHRKTK